MRLQLREPAYDEALTGTTPGAASVAFLVSGTSVLLAGSGLNLTAPLPIRLSFSLLPEKAVPPVVKESVITRRRTRKKPARDVATIHEMIAAIPKLTHLTMPEPIVLHEKLVRQNNELSAPLKLTGKPGSAPKPTAKSYDLDLDEYQS